MFIPSFYHLSYASNTITLIYNSIILNFNFFSFSRIYFIRRRISHANNNNNIIIIIINYIEIVLPLRRGSNSKDVGVRNGKFQLSSHTCKNKDYIFEKKNL